MRAWLEHEEPRAGATSAGARERLVIAVGRAARGSGSSLQCSGAPATRLAAVSSRGDLPRRDVTRRAARWASLRAGVLDINVLMLVAVAGAMALGDWAEGGVGRLPVRARAVARSARDGAGARRHSRADGSRAGRGARAVAMASIARVAIDDVRVGDVVVVRPGEKIPLDGAWPPARATSTRRRSPASRCRSTRSPATRSSPARSTVAARWTSASRGCARDSTLARIIHLVERAQAQRAPSQTFVDRFARVYTPIVLVLAVADRRSCRRSSSAQPGARGSIARSCCWSSPARARS